MDRCHKLAVVFLVLLVSTSIVYSSPTNNTVTDSTSYEKYCPSLKRPSPLNWDQIIGKWYVVEVVKHKIDPTRSTNTSHETITIKTCPVVQIKLDESRLYKQDSDAIRLSWTEDAGDLEYSFYMPDAEKTPGLWKSKGLQNGTLTSQRYIQFFGVVQVVKATEQRMVLTFCSVTVQDQIFSIILSRTNHLQESFAMRIQNMLSRHGLIIDSVKETCVNVESSAG